MALTAPFDGFITELRAASGQTVAAGAPVADLAQTSALWIRAAVYVGDLRVARHVAAGDGRGARPGNDRPVAAGAARDRTAGREPDRGERRPVLRAPGAAATGRCGLASGWRVRLPLKATDRALVVPQSAVVYDVNGGTWVYEQRAPHQFARRRVELGGPAGANVIVARGLAEGMTIVTVGAAELYGTEFYVSK